VNVVPLIDLLSSLLLLSEPNRPDRIPLTVSDPLTSSPMRESR
jgi:hypothetical protein